MDFYFRLLSLRALKILNKLYYRFRIQSDRRRKHVLKIRQQAT